MKKWIALILALVMVLGMVGCGGAKEPELATQTPEQTTNTPLPVEAANNPNIINDTKPNDLKIDLETPVIIYEDENVKLELTYFWQKVYGGEKVARKGIGIKAYNLSDHDLVFTTSNIYIGDNEAIWIWAGSGNGGPPAGKTKELIVSFNINGFEKTEVESIRDFFLLEFRLCILNVFNEEKNNYSYQQDIRFSDIIDENTIRQVEDALEAAGW